MSQEMSDINEISKNLNDIVHHLSKISKGDNLNIQSGSKLVKTNNMTYQDFIKLALGNRPAPVNSGKKQSYCLEEDLKLLIELSHKDGPTNKAFEEISNSKKINRTSESLRSRYKDHLNKVEEAHMKKICSWIEQNGVEGFLYFQNKQLILTKVDPKDKGQASSKPKARGSRDEATDKKKESSKKPTKMVNTPANCKELNETVQWYMKTVGMPVKDLLQRLDQLSGDFNQLDHYIETRDDRLLWTGEEDSILRNGNASEVDVLTRFKGVVSVDSRKKYMQF